MSIIVEATMPAPKKIRTVSGNVLLIRKGIFALRAIIGRYINAGAITKIKVGKKLTLEKRNPVLIARKAPSFLTIIAGTA
jgi:hypothetical protein